MAVKLDKNTARYERKAIRDYLKRQIKKCLPYSSSNTWKREAFSEVLTWVYDRQRRYDKKDGGL